MTMGLQFAGLSIYNAEVVKLANTLRSGRSERKLLWVQLPPSAWYTVYEIIKRKEK